MKKQVWISIGIILLTTVASLAQTSGDFPVPLSDPNKRGTLKASLHSGSITVRGTARKDVLVKYSSPTKEDHDGKAGKDGLKLDVSVKYSSPEKEEHRGKAGKDGLKRISGGSANLEVSEYDNTVKVESDSWNNKLDIDIEVPSGFDLKVSTYNDGDLHIGNIQGEVELNNYNGEITAENISGSVVASTYNGEIKVTFDKVTEGAPMSFSTYNGDVDLSFPGTLKASLKMKTEQGEILTGFDMNLVKSGPVQKKDGKSGTYKVTIDEWVKGDVNGGGAEFTMKTYNGDVIIRKK